MADTEIVDDTAAAPEGPAIDAEDPRHLDAAQMRVAQLMRDASDHGTHQFFTGDGVLTFKPLSEDEKARVATQVRRWAEGENAPQVHFALLHPSTPPDVATYHLREANGMETADSAADNESEPAAAPGRDR